MTHTVLDSPLGPLTLVAADGVLAGLYLPEHQRQPARASFGARVSTGFEQAREQLQEYFTGQRTEFTVPTRLAGTPFQRQVWATLETIGYGHTWSYAQLAHAMGGRDKIRAVASANARNPVSIVVPCHRVIGSDGALTGYAGGLARKRWLLDLEHNERLL